jgi:hypothetical protein
MNFFELNKLSYLHNRYDIFFCKTDYLLEDFNTISKLKNQVILITGNSDYPIVDHILQIMPKNIKKWYATNCLTNSSILQPIPLGLENKQVSKRENHGVGYLERASLKEELLSRKLNINPNKFIYANFKIESNPSYRIFCKEICNKIEHIDLEENELPLEIFFNRILEYKMVFCPIGNGIDTHRLWEVLYSNRIPIVIKVGNFKIYELYEKLPIVILDKIEDLNNKDLIEHKVSKLNYDNLHMLDINYWINNILTEQKNI